MSRAIIRYTCCIYAKDEPVVETYWSHFPAAMDFANKMIKFKDILLLKIWNGEGKEGDSQPVITEDPALLYVVSK